MSSWEQVLFSSLIVIASGIIQGTVGFGFALIAVPLLSLFLPITMAVPIIVICGTMTSIMILTTAKRYVSIKQIWVLILFGIIGIPIGVYVLKNMNSDVLMLIIGVILIITVIVMFKGYKVSFKNKKFGYGIAGLISGILNGGASLSGPPIVLFLTNEGYNKNSFRANISAYCVITNIIAIGSFFYGGLLNIEVIKLTGTNIIALLIGSIAGIVMSKRFKEKTFKGITLMLLLIMGLTTVVKAIAAIIAG